MNVKETSFLNVLADYSFSEKEIVINPNDGFDLGLMQTEATAVLYFGHTLDVFDDPNAKSFHIRIYQKNECRLNTVEMSLKNAEKLGNPKKVRIHLLEDDPYPKVLINPE